MQSNRLSSILVAKDVTLPEMAPWFESTAFSSRSLDGRFRCPNGPAFYLYFPTLNVQATLRDGVFVFLLLVAVTVYDYLSTASLIEVVALRAFACGTEHPVFRSSSPNFLRGLPQFRHRVLCRTRRDRDVLP